MAHSNEPCMLRKAPRQPRTVILLLNRHETDEFQDLFTSTLDYLLTLEDCIVEMNKFVHEHEACQEQQYINCGDDLHHLQK
jgi:hypothetical protein